MEKVFKVEGMMCEHCKKRVENAVMELEGVTGATADYTAGTLVVTFTEDVSDALIKDAVSEAGYDVV